MRVEVEDFSIQDVKKDKYAEVEAQLDLGKLELKNQINESFDDLIEREWYRKGNLYELNKLRLLLKENGKLIITNSYKGPVDEAYLFRLEILLNKAGFVDLKLLRKTPPLRLEAVKRPLFSEEFEYGMHLREVIDPEETQRCHEFAKDYYYYKDFNYDFDVVRQFDLNADLIVVYDGSGNISSLVRSILRVPDYYCPFMYAVDAEGGHYRIPDGYVRFGEMMALYKEGKKGVVAFKRLMESLTQYASSIGKFDSIWTTYDETDNYTGTYYKTKFRMKEMGVKLYFRDFGGAWKLLLTDRIDELRKIHKDLFKR
jgi:hypothetical protein